MTPRWMPDPRSRLRSLLRGRAVEPEIDDELAFHLAQRTEQLMGDGMSRAEAEAEARRRFGDLDGTKLECVRTEHRRVGRRARAEALWAFWGDLRLALRVWRRAPALTALAVAAIAIGTGVVAAVFSIAHGVLLAELPYPDEDGLALVYAASPGADRHGLFSHQELTALIEGVDGLDLVAHSMARQPVTGAGIEPVELGFARVTRGFFEVFGLPPLHGRTPAAEEYERGLPVVVIGHPAWVRLFGEDPGVLGRRIELGGTPHRIIGIMPPAFSFPAHAAMWRPLTPREQEDDDRELQVAARLPSGISIDRGSARVDRALAAYQRATGVGEAEARTAWLGTARASLVRTVRTPLLLLLGAAALVLLVACVDVSNLLLAHAESRRDQLAVRRALGASRRSLVRQHLAESLLISGLGASLGLVAAWLTLPVLLRLVPADTPRISEVGLDGTVVAVLLLVAVLTTVATGLVPALRAGRITLAGLVASSRRVADGRSWLLDGFVTAQISLSTVLVLGATLLGASFLRFMAADRGFATEGSLVVPLSLSDRSEAGEGGAIAAYDRIVAEARTVPGVREAHLVYHSPVEGRGFNLRMLQPEGLREEEIPRASVLTVTPGYLSAAGIRLSEGRGFADTDDASAPAVAIASESFARRVLPPGPVVGARFRHGTGRDGEPVEVTIVGVAADIQPDPASSPGPILYVPWAQLALPYAELLIRTDGDPAAVLPALRQRIWRIDPEVPLNSAFTIEQAVAAAAASPRFYLLVVGLFAGLALLLAVAGVYGVTAYTVSRRAREIGVRSAMGADAGRIIRLFVARGARPVMLGIGLGLAVAVAASRLMHTLLFDVATVEPVLYLAVAASLAIIGLVATALPARRVARIDPLDALRPE